ncbi:hypothetical protein KFL_003730060 [Klebsormidium nitens]|uniref:Late embryogenesis abundant protein n=1 Tax=Klebsormidium nitens TaxID=105231 RepID=A0A1Y1IE90_KLENI|nr:hypothetical protein KFL_003730060 [Klebsormidium nitens]|eukprot:GAQ87729.1 hypothetical protein KFL_003730060 [Klebsormidium nitens]
MLAGRVARRAAAATWGTSSRSFASSEVPSPESSEAANKGRAREDGRRVAEKAAEGKPGEAKDEAGNAFSDMAKGLSEAGRKVSKVAKETGSRLKETVSGAREGASQGSDK